MKAYLRERDNRWHIRYVDRNNPDHKEFVESFEKDKYRKSDIQSKIDHINHRIKFKDFDPWAARRRKKIDAKKRYPLGKAIEDFITDNTASGNWLPNTKRAYRERLRRLRQGFGAGTPIGELSQQKVQQWMSDRDIAAITKKSHSSEINYFLKWLYENGYTDEQWKIGVTNLEQKEIRNNRSIKHITYRQLTDIDRAYRWYYGISKRMGHMRRSSTAAKYPDAWWFMFWQMLRKNELPQITADDIKGNKVRIHGKGNKIEWIYMVPPAQKIARRKLKEVKKGRPLFDIKHKSTLYKNFRKASNLALGNDHPSGLHQLRHGGAVHYLSLGKPVQFVSKMLRHEHIGVTLRVYADILEDSLEEVFEDIKDSPAQ